MDTTTQEALEAARDTLGALHIVEEGPDAGWHGVGEDLYYDGDERCRADCPVCGAIAKVNAALDAR
jgi:hypothetical protein